MLNPLSIAPAYVIIQTLTSDGLGVTDSGIATFTPILPAAIDSASVTVSADVTTVQEVTKFKVTFNTPVPMNASSTVIVMFPMTFSFDVLNTINAAGLFGFS